MTYVIAQLTAEASATVTKADGTERVTEPDQENTP